MLIDKIIIEIDKVVKTLSVKAVSIREHPDANINEEEMSESQKKHSISLMRINHCGEICAQALYQGQALTSRNQDTRELFENSAFEEIEHLAWTSSRIHELGGRTSVLNPLFYFASLTMGVTAGVIGDKWNMGFLEETELQVSKHLSEHLEEISKHDTKSIAIIKQMKEDEEGHAMLASQSGAVELPDLVKNIMQFGSKIMTKTTYYI
jgi:ubiquinone biosynthesis monooxygenase Coq7